ncbi:MAG: hypothetical protein RLZ23_459 [Actinomycetota bacterium]
MSQLPAGLSVGQAAPDFELKNQYGELVKLSSFKGDKNVVVLFIPFAFTGTCTGELCAIRDDLSSFQNDNVQVLAISCDSPFTQKIFAEQEGYHMAQQHRRTGYLMQISVAHSAAHLSSINQGLFAGQL